jgi:spore germination cell wall hydrolase CwlJ-like protein
VNLRSAEPISTSLDVKRWQEWVLKNRFVLSAALLVSAVFALGLLIGNFTKDSDVESAQRRNTAPPVVEPLLLQKVDTATAKKTNDAVPLTNAPVPSASAFIFRGTPADFERATDCLAATIFYEAGNETIAGQMAVVQVVLNRARHPAYPKSVCGVVFQGQERRTGCQFSYTCDGSMARRPSPEAWFRHRSLAAAMLKGLVYPQVGLATHYHTDWVLPVWSARLDKVRIEGTHLFFRFNGYWGTPAAYRGKVSGNEPAFAKLAALSPAHAGEQDAQTALLEAPGASEFPDAPDVERIATTLDNEDASKEVFLIYVDPLLDSAALTRMADNACGARKTCKVFAWADQALMPHGLPLEPSDRASMAFSYIRAGKSAGRQKWNCELFPRDTKTECL